MEHSIPCDCGQPARHESRLKVAPHSQVFLCHTCFDRLIQAGELLLLADWPKAGS